MSLHQRLRNQTLVQQSLFVFAVLTLNEVVVWGIEGWSGHRCATPWRWIQPMIGAMLWPFVAMLVGRTHTPRPECAGRGHGNRPHQGSLGRAAAVRTPRVGRRHHRRGAHAVADRPAGGAAGGALRLLRRAVAGQPRARRAPARATRPHSRSQRGGARREPSRVPARTGARARAGRGRHAQAAGRDRRAATPTTSTRPASWCVRAAASTACPSGCASPTRKSRASPCTASSSRAWTSPRVSRASIRMANTPCTRSATWRRSAKQTSRSSRRKTSSASTPAPR